MIVDRIGHQGSAESNGRIMSLVVSAKNPIHIHTRLDVVVSSELEGGCITEKGVIIAKVNALSVSPVDFRTSD